MAQEECEIYLISCFSDCPVQSLVERSGSNCLPMKNVAHYVEKKTVVSLLQVKILVGA